jgi:N-succinyldiaminopimelate aminotransferase
VIAADECYSEIYFGDTTLEGGAGAPRSGDVTPQVDGAPASTAPGSTNNVRGCQPLGALQAAQQLGRSDYHNLVVFSSLSKRSNVPGMRSGFVAGDAAIIARFTLYRTYHGCAMNPAVQAASIAAWNDEAHVTENRRLYAEKFARVSEILKPVLPVTMPDAGFYLWLKTPIADTAYAQQLYRDYNVTVLPGSFLARDAQNTNPGENFVRIALVAEVEETLDAARRIAEFTTGLKQD